MPVRLSWPPDLFKELFKMDNLDKMIALKLDEESTIELFATSVEA